MKRVISILVAILLMVTSVNWVVSATVNETIINDSTTGDAVNQFKYYGNWGTSTNQSALQGGDEHWTNQDDLTNKYFTVKFSGSGIQIYASKDTAHGLATVNVDGTAYPDADFGTTGTRQNKQRIFSVTGLTDGEHILTVRGKGANGVGTGKALQVDYASVIHGEYVATAIESEDNVSVFEGISKQLVYSAVPNFISLNDVTFTSADTTIATVSTTGLVAGVKAGSTTVTIASAQYKLSKVVTVTVKTAPTVAHAIIGDTNTHYTQDRFEEVLGTTATPKDLFAWKGDVVNSSVVIASMVNLTNVQVTASDFVSGANTFAKSNIDVKFIKEVRGYVGYGSGNPATNPYFPDIIDTGAAISMTSRRLQSVWMQVNTPSTAVPGVYTGKISVTATELNTPIDLDYTLQIFDIAMPTPENYDMKMEMWQFPDSAAAYYGVTPWGAEHINILKKQAVLAKEMGANEITVPLISSPWRSTGGIDQAYTAPVGMIKWIKNSTTGALTFDFSVMDKWITLNEEAMKVDKIVFFGMLPWDPTKYDFNLDTADGRISQEIIGHGSARWTEVWTKFLDAFIPHVEAKGWFDRVFMAADERPAAALNSMMALLDAKAGTNGKTLKRALSLDHFDGDRAAASAAADTVFVGYTAARNNQAFKNFRDQRDASTTKDYVTGLYFCTGMSPNNFTYSIPGESYYSTMYTGAIGASGFERWAFDAFNADPLRDSSHRLFESGDCFLIYPDEKANKANPETKYSVRLRKLYEGLSDANKLKYIAKNAPTLVADVDAIYASMKHSYPFTGRDIPAGDTKTVLPADMNKLRADIGEISRKFDALDGTVIANKIVLNNNITAATTKHNAAVEGTEPGQYSVGSKATYLTAINAAKAVKDNANATQTQVDAAVAALAAATTVFNNAIVADNVVLKVGDINADTMFNIEDALYALKVSTTILAQPTGNRFTNGNVRNTGTSATVIDISDISALLASVVSENTPTVE